MEVNIDELILNDLFKVVINDLLNNLSVMVVTSLRSTGPCQLKVYFSTLNALLSNLYQLYQIFLQKCALVRHVLTNVFCVE